MGNMNGFQTINTMIQRRIAKSKTITGLKSAGKGVENLDENTCCCLKSNQMTTFCGKGLAISPYLQE